MRSPRILDNNNASQFCKFPIGQTVGDVGILQEYAQLVEPSEIIIEVGTRNGGSAIMLALASESSVVTIDILEDSRFDDENCQKFYGMNAPPPLREHFDSFYGGNRIEIVNCCSWEYKHDGRTVGMVFLDGGHTLTSLKRDYEHFSKILSPEGYMLFHDYGSVSFPEVGPFVDELNVIDWRSQIAVVQEGGQ